MKIFKIIILLCLIFILGFTLAYFFVPNKHSIFYGIHYSSKDPQLVNSALAKIGPAPKISGVSLAVVNHHLLASDLIAGTLSRIASVDPITIILVSPNHFSRGQGQIISSRFDWSTPFGTLSADQKTIDFLTRDQLVNVDESPFAEEHGIYNIVQFIKKFFPKAELVPLILRDDSGDERIDLLAKRLTQIPNSLVVFSLDFSHYQTEAIAYQHDDDTLQTISSYNYKNIKNLDVDSKVGIRLMLKLSELENIRNFHILYHSNSANYTGDKQETTSYIDGVFTSSLSE